MHGTTNIKWIAVVRNGAVADHTSVQRWKLSACFTEHPGMMQTYWAHLWLGLLPNSTLDGAEFISTLRTPLGGPQKWSWRFRQYYVLCCVRRGEPHFLGCQVRSLVAWLGSCAYRDWRFMTCRMWHHVEEALGTSETSVLILHDTDDDIPPKLIAKYRIFRAFYLYYCYCCCWFFVFTEFTAV